MALSRKLFLGCTTIGLGVPLLTLGGGLLWTVRTFGGDAQRLEEERAAARREGVPLTGEDLRSKVPVPDAENAAIPIRQIRELWPEGKRRQEERPLEAGRKETATEAERTEARKILTRLAPVLALAYEAANRPACDFEYDFNLGVKLQFPELADMRALARLLCTEAELTDSPEKAFAAIQATARLGKHAGTAPTLICGLVQVAIGTIAHRQFALSLARFGKPAIPYAHAALDSWGEARSFTHYLGGESVFYHVTAQQFIDSKISLKDLSNSFTDGSSDSSEQPQTPGIPPVVGPMVVRAWATRGVVYWRGMFQLIRENEKDIVHTNMALKEYNQRWEESWTKQKNPQDILLAILVPVLSQAMEKLYLFPLAERRLRETMLALVEANGKGVPLPQDPFAKDDAPLKLRREGKGFTLWSIGQDRIDNGGVRDKDKKVKDLVVTYPGSR